MPLSAASAAFVGSWEPEGGHCLKNWIQDTTQEIFVCVQIETRESLSNADAMTQVPGPDFVFVGPGGLGVCLAGAGELQERMPGQSPSELGSLHFIILNTHYVITQAVQAVRGRWKCSRRTPGGGHYDLRRGACVLRVEGAIEKAAAACKAAGISWGLPCSPKSAVVFQ
jgi:hypothetical protein